MSGRISRRVETSSLTTAALSDSMGSRISRRVETPRWKLVPAYMLISISRISRRVETILSAATQKKKSSSPP